MEVVNGPQRETCVQSARTAERLTVRLPEQPGEQLGPVGASSILHPALPFLAAGDRATAGVIAEETLTVAERWGVAGQTGSCLTTLGLVSGRSEGLGHLRRAVDLLESRERLQGALAREDGPRARLRRRPPS